MFGCYRTGDANDPETYVAAVTAMLAEFSNEVIQEVTDPRRGLPAKMNWLPTVSEVRTACMEQARHLQLKEHLAKRGRLQALPPARARRDLSPGRLSYDEATHGGRIRPIGRFENPEDAIAKYGMKPAEIDRFRESQGVTREEWDELPNA